MSLTFLQERKLRQLEDEIIFLEREVSSKGYWHCMRVGYCIACMMLTITFAFDVIFDDITLQTWVNDYEVWGRFAIDFLIWSTAEYFWHVWHNRKSLTRKRKDVIELRKRYRLNEESAS